MPNVPAQLLQTNLNFLVVVDGLTLPEYLFHRVDGLTRTYDVETVAEGGRNHAKHTLWKGAANGQVTLASGLVLSSDLWDWSRAVDSGTDFKKDVKIVQLGFNGTTPIQVYRLIGAWPVSWSATGLDAQSGKLSIVELKLAYDDLLVGLTATSPAAPTKAVLTTTEGAAITFNFPLNPSAVKLERSVAWAAVPATATIYPTLTAPGGQLDSLTVSDVYIDGGDTKTSIATQLATLHSMLLATEISGVQQMRPPLAKFTWKDLRFVGGITKLGVDVVLFSAEGDPLRAKVSISMTGQVLFAGSTQLVNVNADGSA